MSTPFFEKFYNMEAMRYFDKPDDNKLSDTLLVKKYNMINNKDNAYIATQKWDGNWMMFIKDTEGNIYARGRSRNVKGDYENYMPKLPHLLHEIENWPLGTVILGEVCWAEMGKIATDVGTILRCLPQKAVDRQKDEKLVVKVFDILAWDGKEYINSPFDLRWKALNDQLENGFFNGFFTLTNAFYSDFAEAADNIIAQGGEGLVIQARSHVYEPGKRTSWQTLKLKQKLPSVEYKVIGTLNPTRLYNGIQAGLWSFWEGTYQDSGEKVLIDHEPGNIDMEADLKWERVTKPYYYGWKVGVIIDFDGNEVKVSSGLTDADAAWLSTKEAQEYIEQEKLYAEVKGMQETENRNGGKSIRHPSLIRLRVDM